MSCRQIPHNGTLPLTTTNRQIPSHPHANFFPRIISCPKTLFGKKITASADARGERRGRNVRVTVSLLPRMLGVNVEDNPSPHLPYLIGMSKHHQNRSFSPRIWPRYTHWYQYQLTTGHTNGCSKYTPYAAGDRNFRNILSLKSGFRR